MILAGTAFYLSGVIWATFYSTPLPLERDECIEALQEEGPSGELAACNGLAGDVEVLTYYHNQDMRVLNGLCDLVMAIVGVGLALLVFRGQPYTVTPDGSRRLALTGDYTRKVMLGLIAALAIPWVLVWVMPSPRLWLPRALNEVAERKTSEIRRAIVRRAQQLETALKREDQRQ